MSSFSVFVEDEESSNQLIQEAAVASKIAMDLVVRSSGRNGNKVELAEKMLAAAMAASASIYVNAIKRKEEEKKLKEEEEMRQKAVLEEHNKLSPELKKMVDLMYASIKPHVDVFPDAPQPEDIAIPTGGLAKCECSPGCTKELPQPAYQIIKNEEQDKRWNVRKETRVIIVPKPSSAEEKVNVETGHKKKKSKGKKVAKE